MALIVIWIDRENAKIFDISHEKMERKTIHSKHTDHHTHLSDGLDITHWERAFFADVVTHLDIAEKILILGPGMAKHHFQTYLMEQQPLVAKKVVGCETVDHPSDAQIGSLARHFFSSSFV